MDSPLADLTVPAMVPLTTQASVLAAWNSVALDHGKASTHLRLPSLSKQPGRLSKSYTIADAHLGMRNARLYRCHCHLGYHLRSLGSPGSVFKYREFMSCLTVGFSFHAPVADEVLNSSVDHDLEPILQHWRNQIVIVLHPVSYTMTTIAYDIATQAKSSEGSIPLSVGFASSVASVDVCLRTSNYQSNPQTMNPMPSFWDSNMAHQAEWRNAQVLSCVTYPPPSSLNLQLRDLRQ